MDDLSHHRGVHPAATQPANQGCKVCAATDWQIGQSAPKETRIDLSGHALSQRRHADKVRNACRLHRASLKACLQIG